MTCARSLFAVLLVASVAHAEAPTRAVMRAQLTRAKAMGLSSGVAKRVVRFRPDVLDAHDALKPDDLAGRHIYIGYRGLHDVTLETMRPDYARIKNESTYVQAGGDKVDPKSTWAFTFVKSRVDPAGSSSKLLPGFMLVLELPGHMLDYMDNADWARGVYAGAMSNVGGAVATLSPASMPSLAPFISKIGFTAGDGSLHFHSYDALFSRDGKRTHLAQAIDANMTASP